MQQGVVRPPSGMRLPVGQGTQENELKRRSPSMHVLRLRQSAAAEQYQYMAYAVGRALVTRVCYSSRRLRRLYYHLGWLQSIPGKHTHAQTTDEIMLALAKLARESRRLLCSRRRALYSYGKWNAQRVASKVPAYHFTSCPSSVVLGPILDRDEHLLL